ncbi:MAG: MBL fold metallo-hydrolase, partial [Verrucomicrobiota bacterium]|nr:MBL fold metallo-hydrolase [Verrucomicrobiota bacterium]
MKEMWRIWSLVLMMTPAFAQLPEGLFSYQVGRMEIILLPDQQGTGNADILLHADPDMLERLLPDGTFANAIHAFLIRTPHQTLLVDSGFGTRLPDHLEALGVAPGDIHTILLTHMHGDHIGGLLRNGQAAFPTAEIYVAQREHDYWAREAPAHSAMQTVLAQYDGRFRLFQPLSSSQPFTFLLPGIQGFAAYGHTPGHTMYLLESDGEKLLIWGDLVHAMAIQMPDPRVAVTYDVAPEEAVQTRVEVLRYVAENHLPVAGMHIPFPGMGTLQPDR